MASLKPSTAAEPAPAPTPEAPKMRRETYEETMQGYRDRAAARAKERLDKVGARRL